MATTATSTANTSASSSKKSKSLKKTTEQLTALPSMTSALHALPQATSLQGLNMHPHFDALRCAQSEAKLKKALARTQSSATLASLQPPPMYPNPPAYSKKPSGKDANGRSKKPKFIVGQSDDEESS